MSKELPAYLIASSIMPEGHDSIMPYFEAAHPLFEAAGAEVVVAGAAGQAMHHFEGNWTKDASLTIFEFPSMKALLGLWNSPEYQSIKHLRTDAIQPNFTFAVDGFGGFDDLSKYE